MSKNSLTGFERASTAPRRRDVSRLVRLQSLAVLVLLLPALLWVAARQSPTHIVIMHTNDIHGQLLPRNGAGGMAEMATLIRSARPDLILDAGDLFTGTFLSDEFKGEPTIRAMNLIGYMAAAIGNHEFDYGQDALRMRVREARFPFLSANSQTPVREIRRYSIITAKGIRFGVIGLTTEELTTTTHPKNLAGVTVQNAVKTLQQLLPEVRSRADFIIVLSHITDTEERAVAALLPEIRLIIGGHTHGALGPVWAGHTMIAKTGSSGRNVGRVDLDFEGNQPVKIEGSLIPVINVAPDPQIAKMLAPYSAKVAEKMSMVLGEAAADLTRSAGAESALANLIADALRAKAKTQIALQNIGGIRTPLLKGPISWGHVYEVLPFPNTLVTLKLTGAQLKKTLGVALLAVSGIRVEMDLQKPSGERLVSVRLPDGTPILDSRLYSVATNDFVLAGGDGFTEFAKGVDIKDTGILLRDVFVEYVKARRVLSPLLDGRIVVI
jgi:2',3'-cyclic-nucleotide 2'-phosphodiesterase (5'-nucleotidase family)